MRSIGLLFAASLTLAAGCIDAEEGEPTGPNLLEDGGKADDTGPLWAGLTSITIERYVPDPCNEGRGGFGDDPYVYGDWARQRAAIRNICFEVWMPGVTDWDNPDFWQHLDVQVHYRHGSTGAFQNAYVNSNGRRGNNRRYAWALESQLDPTTYLPSLVQMNAPFRILSESNGWALIESDLELYFTVNGRALKTTSNRNYVVRYQGYVRTGGPLAANAAGYVLHDIVTCEGGAVRFGSGAGYFAADMDHAKALPLTAGLDGSMIYGVGVAHADNLVQMRYSSQQTIAGQTLPVWIDAAGMRILPNGTSMNVELDVYHRATSTRSVLSTTFDGCVKVSTN